MIIIYITYTNLHKETSYIKSKIIIIRHETMVIKQEMYSPSTGMEYREKFGKSENTCEQAIIPYYIYIKIYTYI